jgi:hypothetical protein
MPIYDSEKSGTGVKENKLIRFATEIITEAFKRGYSASLTMVN